MWLSLWPWLKAFIHKWQIIHSSEVFKIQFGASVFYFFYVDVDFFISLDWYSVLSFLTIHKQLKSFFYLFWYLSSCSQKKGVCVCSYITCINACVPMLRVYFRPNENVKQKPASCHGTLTMTLFLIIPKLQLGLASLHILVMAILTEIKTTKIQYEMSTLPRNFIEGSLLFRWHNQFVTYTMDDIMSSFSQQWSTDII